MCAGVRLLATMSFLLLLDSNASAEPREDNTVSREEQTIRSEISADEEVVFYPTYGHLNEERAEWTIPIHGIIYEPEHDSRKRNALVASVRKAMQLSADESKSQFFVQRLRLFLVDNERNQDIFVRMGKRVFAAGTSEANGHFRGIIRLAADEVEQMAGEAENAGWLTFEAVTRPSDERRFFGRVQLIRPAGLSVISDIDDTIKHSQVGDHKALLANTFLRQFKPVPGMPELYRRCAEQGIAFHYVSGSPWQLYLPLSEFIEAERFPKGSFHLKHFRLKDRSMVGLLQSQEAHKLGAIEPILATYPHRRFILIGDSGEQDPEIYATVGHKYPDQIAAIFIRNVTDETIDNPRFVAVRKGLGDVRFELFEDPDSLRPAIREIVRTK